LHIPIIIDHTRCNGENVSLMAACVLFQITVVRWSFVWDVISYSLRVVELILEIVQSARCQFNMPACWEAGPSVRQRLTTSLMAG